MARRARPNPPELLVFGTNPDRSTPGARRLGTLHEVSYEHDTEGLRRHDFDGVEIIELLRDGSLRIYHPDGEALWIES